VRERERDGEREREGEGERELGVSTLAYYPLAMGLLTGPIPCEEGTP